MTEHKSISIADQIFEQLEHDILAGKYPRGEILSETNLAAALGVSRTPVREAIRRLEQEHLLSESGRSLVVVGIFREDMMDMYEIRLQLEGLAAARAARNISDEALQAMKETLDLQRFYIGMSGVDNSDRIKDLDSRFHEQLYLATGSNAYCDTLLPLHKKMTKFRKASVQKSGRALKSLEEHTAIYEALARHDEAAASEMMLQHTLNARASMAELEV